MVIGNGSIVGRHQSLLALSLITAALALLTSTAAAQVIDFETIPGGEPAVGLVISDQFEATYGVRFSVSDGTDLVLGDYGGEFQGWVDDSLANDVLQPGYDRGQFFAVYPGAQTPGRYLVIEYVIPTSAAAFDIIDIDDGPGNNPGNEEQWTIRIFDASDSLIAVTVITAGDPGTGDAIPTRYSVDFEGAQSIARIEVEYTGRAQTPGLAFDSFSPAASAGVTRSETSWGAIKALFGERPLGD
jgi:hypothetical protein